MLADPRRVQTTNRVLNATPEHRHVTPGSAVATHVRHRAAKVEHQITSSRQFEAASVIIVRLKLYKHHMIAI